MVTTSGSSGALLHALELADSSGWSIVDRPLAACLVQARALGMVEVPTRVGDPPIGSVRAVSQEQAHRASLSAVVGFGVMPLHTDGAHLREPPAYTLLEAVHADPEEHTLLWRVTDNDTSDNARHGVFAVLGRGAPFAAHAIDSLGHVRFDPGCMKARDQMARRATASLLRRTDAAFRHSWASAPDAVLVINNRTTLHGRAAVSPGSSRLLRRLMLSRPS